MAYADVVLTDGPVRYVRLEETSGPSVRDERLFARQFNGSTDNIVRSVGALAAMTHGTIAALVRITNFNDFRTILNIEDSSENPRISVYTWTPAGQIALQTDADDESIGNFAPEDGWFLVIIRKESGTVTPRWSMFDFDTQTWDHTEGNNTVANATAPGAGGAVVASYEGLPDFLGRSLVVAVWANSLPWAANSAGDAAIESAGLHQTLAAWLAAGPDAMWPMTQPTAEMPVRDMTGGGAHETSRVGTTAVQAGITAFATGAVDAVDLDVAGPPTTGSAGGFDGSARIDLPPAVPGLPLTIEAWVRTTSSATMAVYAETAVDSADQVVQLGVAGGVVEVVVRAGTSRDQVTGSTTVADGAWHHIAAVLTDGGAQVTSVAVYVDGVQDGAGSIASAMPTVDRAAIGALPQSTPVEHLTGAVDEVAVYDTALSGGQIRDHFHAGMLGVRTSVEGHNEQPTLNLQTDSSPQPGDLLVLLHVNADYTVDELQEPGGGGSGGWTQHGAADGGSGAAHGKIWVSEVTTGGVQTVQLRQGEDPGGGGGSDDACQFGWLYVVEGSAGVSAGGGNDGSGTSLQAPSATLAAPPGLLICAWVTAGGTASLTPPGSMEAPTETVDCGTGASSIAAWQHLASAGPSGARTASASTARDWAALSVVVGQPAGEGVSATMAATLPAVQAAAAGALSTDATMAAALPAVQAAMSGGAAADATLAAALPAVQAAMSGGAAADATMAATLPAVQAAAAAAADVGGTLAAALPAVQAHITGQAITPGLVDITVEVGPSRLGWTVGNNRHERGP